MSPVERDRLTDEKWKCAYELFERALDLPASERWAFIQSATTDPDVWRVLGELSQDIEQQRSECSGVLEPKPGDRISHYEIIGKLGEGGMGWVYSARDTELGRIAALKMLSPGLASTPAATERLAKEAKATSALNHPHIVTVYEVVRAGGQVAVAMEFIEGETLRTCCGKPQPLSQVIAWGRHAAQALSAAHERNIVHRDIKPENLMVRRDGYLKVLDFGIARQLPPGLEAGSTNLTRLPGGTLNYMSPEQIRGRPATSASDVFSLGVVLFELATGQHPFLADLAVDTAHAIAHSKPRPVSALNAHVPPAMKALLLAMLAKDPAQRPSASEVDRELGRIEAERADRLPYRSRSLPRRQWVLGALALSIAAVAVLWFARARLLTEKEPVFVQVTRQASQNRVTAAALSPDGKTLAYATLGGPVYLKQLSNGFTRSLHAPERFRVDRIAWFADGTRLLASGTPDDRAAAVWLLSVEGADPRLVVQGRNAAPSPDGASVAYTSIDRSSIWVLHLNTGARRQIRAGGAAASFSSLIWSPDSRRIAYQRQEYAPPTGRPVDQSATQLEKNYLYSYESIDASTGKLRASAKDVIMTSACALPDGRILFLKWVSLPKTLTEQVWEMRTDPHTGRVLSAPRRLTRDEGMMLSSISASNDGRNISVVLTTAFPNVYLADLTPSEAVPTPRNLRRLTMVEASEYPHAWSVDSRFVFFESNRNGHYQLFRQNVDQTDAEPLALISGDSVTPELSGDGEWILFRWSPGPGEAKLMRVSVQGGTPQPVPIAGKLEEFRCAVRPGAGCVLRSTLNDQFVFYALDPVRGQGGELARTAWSPTVFGDWALSPDASMVAIPDHDPHDARIRIVPLRQDAGQERTLSLTGIRNLNGLVWNSNGRGWYVSVRTGAGLDHPLYADLDGRTFELNLEAILPMYALPSPDGRRVAFPGRIISSNAWMLQEF